MGWGFCSNEYEHEREGRDAARRGWLNHDERDYMRERHEDDCARAFADAYEREARYIEERREEERRAEEAAEQRRHEAAMQEQREYEAAMEQAYQAYCEEQWRAAQSEPAPESPQVSP